MTFRIVFLSRLKLNWIAVGSVLRGELDVSMVMISWLGSEHLMSTGDHIFGHFLFHIQPIQPHQVTS